jgi:hypothetical protein
VRGVILILVAANGMFAQTQQAAALDATARGSISGVVRVEGTGDPVRDAEILARRPGGKSTTGKTDSEGRYALRPLGPGSYTVAVIVPPRNGVGFGAQASRPVTLQQDQELTGIDIQVRVPGQISGKVIDENGEPLANIRVALVAREYSSGALRYVFAGAGNTDDQGKYSIGRVMPGRAFLLLAMKVQMRLPAISNAPDDPKLRRPVPVATYYPDSATPDGGEPLILRVGESREGVDIRMRKAGSYCLEGVVIGPPGSSGLGFSIALQRPTSGQSGNGGMYMSVPNGKVAPDGKLRICELHPADYELEVSHWEGSGGPDFMGVAAVTIADRDIAGVRVTALPKIPLPGEVAWDGAAPERPLDTTLTVDLRSLTRTIYPTAKSSIPGQFSFDGLVPDEYSMEVRGLSGGLYLKDVTYGGQSVLRKSLRIGSAPADAALRLLVARDGGFVAARVADKDGNPIGNANVLLIPANGASEAELAASMQSGATDQNGMWTSAALAPGKYFALASPAAVDKSPESIGKLWRARTRAEEVEVQTNLTARVALEVKGIE